MRISLLFLSCLFFSFVLTGCGENITNDPEKLLQRVKDSALGGTYNSYSYFTNPQWKSIKGEENNFLVQFEAEYDMSKIMTASCKKDEFDEWTPEEKGALKGMMHVAVFDVENDAVIPRFSGWGISCNNGETKSFNDPKMNTLKEVKANGWYSDCATMQQLAQVCLSAPSAKEKQ